MLLLTLVGFDDASASLTPSSPPLDVAAGNGGNATQWRLEDIGQGLLAVVVSVMIAGTLIGNVLVCLAVLLVRKLRQPANYLLVSLAVADFCVGLFVMPVALVHLLTESWRLGDLVCYLWTSADVTLCTASILNLCFISLDRYWAITRPLRYGSAQRTTKRILLYVAIVWIVALLMSVTPLVILQRPRSDDTCQVSQNRFYQIYATMISFYVPTVIMIIVYYKIWRAARRLTNLDRAVSASVANNLNNKPSHTNNNCDIHEMHALTMQTRMEKERPRSLFSAVRMPLIGRLQLVTLRQQSARREGKARKTLGLIMTVFVVCWFPFFFLALLKSNAPLPIPSWLDQLVLWLGYSNSLLNPLIYAKYNREFRIPFREMLCCRFKTLQTVMRRESFTMRYGPSPAVLRSSHHSAIRRISSPDNESSVF
uniref:G-protein coupled receptors family 1 profile domain-containing protein n=1 Tax=Plectus sambesii TaxID=2011161 RepID=A0A914VVI1_9BILA